MLNVETMLPIREVAPCIRASILRLRVPQYARDRFEKFLDTPCMRRPIVVACDIESPARLQVLGTYSYRHARRPTARRPYRPHHFLLDFVLCSSLLCVLSLSLRLEERIGVERVNRFLLGPVDSCRERCMLRRRATDGLDNFLFFFSSGRGGSLIGRCR